MLSRIDKTILDDLNYFKGLPGHAINQGRGIDVVINEKVYTVPQVCFTSRPGQRDRVFIPEPIDFGTPDIANVIFNPPATIVFWSDKTKTVVKCDPNQEPYDPEKGIAMAISKKMIGDNKYEYYNVFKHWLKRWNKRHPDIKPQTPTPEYKDNPTEFYR